jgi:dihydroflavonol-4-reductase
MENPTSGDYVVLLTGLTSYLGSWIAKFCLERFPANYKFRASVRSKTNTTKLDPIKKVLGEENFDRIELVEVDLTQRDSIINALEGVNAVIHVASPYDLAEFTTYESYITPVMEGTKALFDGVKQHKVQKVIVTSSGLSILHGL